MIAQILAVPDMAFAWKALAFVGKDGEAQLVPLWTTRLVNVCLTALATVTLIWRHKNVFVKDNGPEMIAPKVIWLFIMFAPFCMGNNWTFSDPVQILLATNSIHGNIPAIKRQHFCA